MLPPGGVKLPLPPGPWLELLLERARDRRPAAAQGHGRQVRVRRLLHLVEKVLVGNGEGAVRLLVGLLDVVEGLVRGSLLDAGLGGRRRVEELAGRGSQGEAGGRVGRLIFKGATPQLLSLTSS